MDWNQYYKGNGLVDTLQNLYNNNYLPYNQANPLSIDDWFQKLQSTGKYTPLTTGGAIEAGAAPDAVAQNTGYQAPTTTNWGDVRAVGNQYAPNAIGADALAKLKAGQVVNGPNGRLQLVEVDGVPTVTYHPNGQGNGEAYGAYDPTTGLFRQQMDTSKSWLNPLTGVLGVFGAGLGMAALGGAAAAGAAGGAGGAGAGLLGDATAAGYGGLSAADAATLGGGASVAGGSSLGGTAAMGAGAAGAGGVTGLGSGADLGAFYGGTDAGATLGGGGSLAGAGSGALGAGTGAAGSGSTSGLGSLASGFDWSKLIGPGLSAVNGLYGSYAANQAAKDQAQAAKDAQAQFAPWVNNGTYAVNRLGTLLGKDGTAAGLAAFQTDPGYQWRLDQGYKGLERAASTRGGLNSGKFLKDAMDYNQGQASQEYGNVYNRLASLAGLGQVATGNSANYGTQAGNAQAAGTIGSANAISNALSQGYSIYNNQQQQDNYNALLKRIMGAY